MPGELPFVGEDRSALVADLVRRFDEVVETGRPLLVTLEASSGWGKTRVVQEFYRRLAAERQTGVDYWPPSILGAVGDDAAYTPRKRVFPERFAGTPGAVPEWFWWGLSATSRVGGAPIQALVNDLAQVEQHSEALQARWRQVAGRRERVRRAVLGDDSTEFGWSTVEEAATSAVEWGLERGLNVVVPGLGLFVTAAKIGWKHRQRLGIGSGVPSDGLEVDAGWATGDDLVATLAEQLGSFAAAGIPVVLVVEDVHDADAALVDLLVRVLNGHGPVMVVVTAWPALLDAEGREAGRLIDEVPVTHVHRSVATDLAGLPEDDLLVLVRALVPDATDAAARMLATTMPNPLAIELATALPRVRDALVEGDVAEVEALPRDVDDLYRAMFLTFPDAVQEALLLAALITPANISEHVTGVTWDAGLVAVGSDLADWLALDARSVPELGRAASAYGWVRDMDEALRRFVEPAQASVAVRQMDDRWSRRRREELLRSLGSSIDLDSVTDPDRRRVAASTLVALFAEGFVDWSDGVAVAHLLLIDDAAETPGTAGTRSVLALTDRLLRHVPAAGGTGLAARAHRATSLAESRRYDEAVDELVVLLDDQTRVLGPDHPDTLTSRSDLAGCLGETGQRQHAVAEFESLVDDRARVLGADHRDTLRARNNLAYWLGETGRADDALAAFERLLVDQSRVLGDDHVDTLLTRNNVAYWYGETGRDDEAVAAFELLVVDKSRVLGGDHPNTLLTRGNLAAWYGLVDRVDEAVAQFEGLLVDQSRVLGADHSDTLATRGKLAAWLGRAGRLDEAVTEFEGLLVDQSRVLGADHSDTLATRDEFAYWLGQAGRLDEAVVQFELLLEGRIRVLGAGHPDTLAARNNLALWLGETGRVEGAVAHLEVLIEGVAGVFDPDHPRTLTVRSNLAYWLGEAGRLDEAVAQFELLLEDQTRVLGEDHPATVTSRGDLERLRGPARGDG